MSNSFPKNILSFSFLEPCDVIAIKQALVNQLKDIVPDLETNMARSRRFSSTGMLIDETDEFGDGLR